MKLSIVVSTQPASFSALAYTGRLSENISKIRGLGYDGVELAVRDPRMLDLPALESVLSSEAMPVPAIGTGQVFGEEGLSLTHEDEKIRRQAIERVKSHVHLAQSLDALVIIGLVRGRSGKMRETGRAERLLLEAVRECASETKSVRLAIEPINRYETDLLNTVASGLQLVEEVQMDNVGLLLDAFHMNIEEPSIKDSIAASGERLFHFHIADSNRWYPGAGHIDFRSIVDTLDGIGYQGFVSAEILPIPDPDTAAAQTIEFMRRTAAQPPDPHRTSD